MVRDIHPDVTYEEVCFSIVDQYTRFDVAVHILYYTKALAINMRLVKF